MRFETAQSARLEHLRSPAFRAIVEGEDPTMVRHIPAFIAMTERGLITFNSQMGADRALRGGDPGDRLLQRAYVLGFMKRDAVAPFMSRMALGDVYVSHVPDVGGARRMSIEDQDKLLPPSWDLPVTVTLRGGDVEVHTHMSPAVIGGYEMRIDAQVEKVDGIVLMCCIDVVWGRQGLFEKVIAGLG